MPTNSNPTGSDASSWDGISPVPSLISSDGVTAGSRANHTTTVTINIVIPNDKINADNPIVVELSEHDRKHVVTVTIPDQSATAAEDSPSQSDSASTDSSHSTNLPTDGPVFPHRFFNEEGFELGSPGTLGPDGRRYWLVWPLVPGRNNPWQPGQDPGVMRTVYTEGDPLNYDVLLHLRDPVVGEWVMAAFYPAVQAEQGQSAGVQGTSSETSDSFTVGFSDSDLSTEE